MSVILQYFHWLSTDRSNLRTMSGPSCQHRFPQRLEKIRSEIDTSQCTQSYQSEYTLKLQIHPVFQIVLRIPSIIKLTMSHENQVWNKEFTLFQSDLNQAYNIKSCNQSGYSNSTLYAEIHLIFHLARLIYAIINPLTFHNNQTQTQFIA